MTTAISKRIGNAEQALVDRHNRKKSGAVTMGDFYKKITPGLVGLLTEPQPDILAAVRQFREGIRI
jgi:hypothetical protein